MAGASSPEFRATLPETVVVSGSASGLGAVCVEQLVDCGCRVIGIDLNPRKPLSGAGEYIECLGDIADEETWERAAGQAESAGSLGLVCCAAVLEVGSILELEVDVWRRTFEVNVIGTALGLRAMIPPMIERGGGSIVTVASVDATFAEQQLISYCASKGAVRQLARTAALDHARSGVRINVVSPGPMKAGLFDRHMASADDPELFLAARANRQPFGRVLAASEVGSAVLHLLSDAGAGLTGADVIVDGGLTVGFDFRTGEEGASVE